MIKSLALQAELAQEFGTCVFDVTLDCEDGAPVGAEVDHAYMVAALVNQAQCATKNIAVQSLSRIAVRVHPVDHPSFERDVEIILSGAGSGICHLMLPKVESVADIERAVLAIDSVWKSSSHREELAIHALIESPLAVQRAASIAAHPRVESLSFGLMDFVSAHGGAIPASAMGLNPFRQEGDLDQFSHPMVVRAKLDISAACHASGKVPSHCVVTEFKDSFAVELAAKRASRELGFSRMWSIHPDQIRPILRAFAPIDNEIEQASEIICAAHTAAWAPISLGGKLHDRASFRYYWNVLERAHQTARLQRDDPAQVFFAS